MIVEPRARDPGVRARAVLARPRDVRPALRGASGSRATRRALERPASAPTRSSRRSPARTGVVESVERKEQTERAPLLYDLTSLQRDANRRFGFSARRTLQRRAGAVRGQEGDHLSAYQRRATCPATSCRSCKPRAATLRPIAEYAAARDATCSRSTSCRSRASSTTRRSTTTTRSSRPTSSRRRSFSPTSGASSTWSRGASSPSSTRRRRYARTTIVTEVEGERFRTRGKVTLEPAGAASTASRRTTDAAEDEEDEARGRRAAGARAGPDGRAARGRGRGEADEAAAALHRGDAALRDGDRRQARSTTRAARGDEGARPRHAGDARARRSRR